MKLLPKPEDLSHWRTRLCHSLATDLGKSPDEIGLSDWLPFEHTWDWLVKNAATILAPQPISSGLPTLLGKRKIVQRNIPWGEVLIIGTWNYPLNLHGGQILHSLFAGNKVCFKPSPQTPQFNETFKQFSESVWPGLIRVWTASDDEVIQSLERGQFQFCIFTGGTQTARVLAKACAQSLTPFVPEASGMETALFLNAPKESELDACLWALWHNSGQTCIAPRIWMIPQGSQAATLKSIESLVNGSEHQHKSRPPLKHKGIEHEHSEWLRWAKSLPSAISWTSAYRADFQLIWVDSLNHVPPQIPANFGPAALVCVYEELRDAIRWIESCPWSLMTTVFGEPNESLRFWTDQITSSIVVFNEPLIACADPAISFGGRGFSGYGVTHGHAGLLALTRPSTQVHVSPHFGLSQWIQTISWKNLKQTTRMGSRIEELKHSALVQKFKKYFP